MLAPDPGQIHAGGVSPLWASHCPYESSKAGHFWNIDPGNLGSQRALENPFGDVAGRLAIIAPDAWHLVGCYPGGQKQVRLDDPAFITAPGSEIIMDGAAVFGHDDAEDMNRGIDGNRVRAGKNFRQIGGDDDLLLARGILIQFQSQRII